MRCWICLLFVDFVDYRASFSNCMELNENLISVFAHMRNALTEDDVKLMDFLLNVNLGHRWPRLEPPTAIAVLRKMNELGMWKVDVQHKECHLSNLILLFDSIERRDLSEKAEDFGWLLIYRY